MEKKEEGSILKVSLDEHERQCLDAIVERISDDIGVTVTMSWVLRTMVRLIGQPRTEKCSFADRVMLKEMLKAAQSGGVYEQHT